MDVKMTSSKQFIEKNISPCTRIFIITINHLSQICQPFRNKIVMKLKLMEYWEEKNISNTNIEETILTSRTLNQNKNIKNINTW